MTQTEMFDLISKLRDCSLYMREIDMDTSNALLNLASSLLPHLEMSCLPEDVRQEIGSIASELTDDNS